ncbi:nucleoside triphosphate pyrophosphatase [Halothiobacillus sp.]|uniref:Maf family protein n=1 Tax=Halothiobacillus sp. TaxID=1891311 RepID=UPI00263A0B7E|nr:Maf family protein [Halothiobacillus sp.]MDD4967679.1 Maf family protein [Halothiobacillus sp.]
MNPSKPLFLASSSPRRAQLLADMGFEFQTLPADVCSIDETPQENESAWILVERLAHSKAALALSMADLPDGSVVLAGDTVVIHQGRIFGKPVDEREAAAMLSALSGQTHAVVTAIAVADGLRCESVIVQTDVTMMSLGEAQIAAYLSTGEPLDKAGAYALQGMAARFVERICGSWGAVVGLPQCETAQLLAEFGIHPVWLQTQRDLIHE